MITRVLAFRAGLASLSPTSRAVSVAAPASLLRGVFRSSVPSSNPQRTLLPLCSLSPKESRKSVCAHLFPSPQRAWSGAPGSRSFSTNSESRKGQVVHDSDTGVAKGWKDKPISQWTQQDVGEWLKTTKKFEPLRPILETLSGGDLVQLTKEELNELLRTLGSGTLTPEYASLGLAFFNTIQDLKQYRPPKSPLARLHEEVRESLENEQKWSMLKAPFESLRVGQFIELPALGERPKELEDTVDRKPLEKVLLTKERLEFIKEVSYKLRFGKKEFPRGDKSEGTIISGPNGIGKTVLSYLTVSVAWANGAIVWYMPKMALWLGPIAKREKDFKEEEGADLLLGRLVEMNAEKLATMPIRVHFQYGYSNLLELIDKGLGSKEATLWGVYRELAKCPDIPVLYVYDEHQWIHKAGLQEEMFFIPFLRKSAMVGTRTYVLISGSSHSKFQDSLESGMRVWLKHLQPLDFEEFKCLVGPNGPFNLPPSDALPTIHRLTGGIPREIRYFVTAGCGIHEFLDSRTQDLLTQIEKFAGSLGSNRKQFLDFLQSVFSPISSQKSGAVSTPTARRFIDTGLLFLTRNKTTYRPTCLSSRRALLRFYYKERPGGRDLEKLKGDVRGSKFQSFVEEALFQGVRFTAFRLDDPNKELVITVPVMKQRLEFSEETIPPNHGDEAVETLYVPSTQNHPAWDLICHEPPMGGGKGRHHLVFVQTSVTAKGFRSTKYPGVILDSFTNGRVATIIQKITGIECTAEVTAEGSIKVIVSPGQAGSLDVQFAFVTELPKHRFTSMKKATGQRALCNLLVVSKEECEDSFNILFDYNPEVESATE